MKSKKKINTSQVNFRSIKAIKKNNQNERNIIKKLPFLKGRSKKSFEKTADSFMGTSNKLFAAIYLSVVALPLSGVIGKILTTTEESLAPSLADIKIFFNIYGVFLVCIYAIAITWAWSFRKTALNIYDSIENEKSV